MWAGSDTAEEKVYRPVRREFQVFQQCRASPSITSLKEIEPCRRIVSCIGTLSGRILSKTLENEGVCRESVRDMLHVAVWF